MFEFLKRLKGKKEQATSATDQGMEEEARKQEEFRLREEAARPRGESVSGGLDDFLKRSEVNLHTRLMAVTRRQTAEAEAEAIRAEQEAERLTIIAQTEQKRAEAATAQMRGLDEDQYAIGYGIFEAFFFGLNKLTDVQIIATLSTPQARKDLEEARLFGDPRLIKAILKKFKGYATNSAVFSTVLPDVYLQEYFKQMVSTPSQIPFWNF